MTTHNSKCVAEIWIILLKICRKNQETLIFRTKAVRISIKIY